MDTNGITTLATGGLTKEDVVKTVLELDVQQEQTPTPQTSQPSTTPARVLPPTTRATLSTPDVQRYIEICADITAHATVDHPLGIIFDNERFGKDFDTASLQLAPADRFPTYRHFSLERIQAKIAGGSFIMEAANFATIICWTPATATPPRPTPQFFQDVEKQGRPIFSNFLAEIEVAREKYLYPVSEKYWHMSLMGRDPRREHVPGAVRALIEPVLKTAEDEGVPVWLEAGSTRARDIYAHFGFVVVHTVVVLHVETFCMIKRC